jgi:DNA invertase Pin-like site-specific DNA recombinase
VSTDQQSESGISLDEQERKIEARSVEMGWSLEHVFVDAGVSGGIPLAKRPAGAKLLAAVQPGDVVVAAKMDRMFRNAADALTTIENFKQRKISLWLLDLGNDCSGNGISELIVTVLAAVAQFERGLISERIKDAKRNQRRNGRSLGGVRPFGFTVDEASGEKKLVPIPEEQAAIDEIVALRAHGASLMAIRDRMRAKGHAISHETVRRLLARHAASGVCRAA